MKTIYRYQLSIVDRQRLLLPVGARVLPAPPNPRWHDDTPDTEPRVIEIWAQVDSDAPVEPREFLIVSTGNPLPGDCGEFIGTVMAHDGIPVWHIFERDGSRRA